MYKIGDYIVKTGKGVCKVENVTHLDMAGVDKSRLYYVLVPINDENGKIYVPVDSSAQQMRRVMSMDEAYALMKRIPSIQEITISNDKLREQKYKETIKDYTPESLLCILKTTYSRKKARLEQGKKVIAVDEYYSSLAEKLFFSEMCLVLGKDKEEILDLIVWGIGDLELEKNLLCHSK